MTIKAIFEFIGDTIDKILIIGGILLLLIGVLLSPFYVGTTVLGVGLGIMLILLGIFIWAIRKEYGLD